MATPAIDFETITTTVPQLEVVDGLRDSRTVFAESFILRDQAAAVEKIDGAELEAVQSDVQSWIEANGIIELPEDEDDRVSCYTDYSEMRVANKVLALVDYLAQNHADKVSPEELAATRSFVESSFAMFRDEPESGDVMPDADGSFAFVVPSRMGRNHTEYGEEVEPVIPAMRYVPNELRAQMLLGLPPFVIDTYKYDEYGRRGYLVFAPVTEDVGTDLPGGKALDAVQTNVNAAVDFAHRRFGVEVVGLGAVLPAFTCFGQTIKNKNVVTTTGHGGTTELINMTIETATGGEDPETIGVLGLGSIGASIANIAADRFKTSKIKIFDAKPNKVQRTLRNAEDPSRFEAVESDTALIEESDVIISAIAGMVIDLDARNVDRLDGKVIVDDSQPGSVIPAQVTERGGNVLWVIGRDSTGRVATRRGYDYATLVNAQTDVFGCEAEAASIYRYKQELKDREMPADMIDRVIRKVALRGPVTPQGARLIGALFKKYGIVAAEPQAFGERVEL